MKRQWRIHRQLIESCDGQRRWDRAYQCLLRWGSCSLYSGQGCVPKEQPSVLVFLFQPPQEVYDASRSVCASVNPTSGPNADH